MVFWVFGYGSLIWKSGFEYDRRVVGFIKDYVRVFHQGSTDHRGTESAPGRTVSLQKKKGGVTWGAAYCVDRDEEEEQRILAYLEWREKQYDVREVVDFHTVQSPEKPVARVLVYIASEDRTRNVYYLGPAPLHDIAKQIATAVGPSGPNYEYLFRLEEALQEIGVVDEEVVVLAELVRNLMASSRAAVRGDKTFNPLPVTLGCQPPHQSTPSHNDANGTPISYREANGFAFIEARATGHSLQIAAEIVAEIAAELPACAAVTPDGVLGASKAAVPS